MITNMKKHTSTNRSPGRPRAVINYPNRKFTFADLENDNPKVTPLTLRKFLKRDAALGKNSEIVRIIGESREPDSSKGLGRKTFVYIPRTKAGSVKVAKSPKAVKVVKHRKHKVAVNAGQGSDYEAIKADLGLNTPTPAPAPAAPAAPSAPEPVASEPVPTAAPATEPVAA